MRGTNGGYPQATIDHSALDHNLKQARKAAPESCIWAVIKANGYGHGMLRVARCLEDAEGFAVARLDEGLALRQQGITKPVLVLSACITADELRAAAQARLDVVLHQRQQLAKLPNTVEQSSPLAVWLKVDTGMHRLGFEVEEVDEITTYLLQHPAVGPVHLMTHLANADDPANPSTQRQCELFYRLDSSRFKARSLANSAGLLGVPASISDWVRPGIMLYGVSPFLDSTASDYDLRPVMTLKSRVIAVKQCHIGEAIGYGGSYCCPQTMPVAVVAIGYGDGYPRHAPSGTPVWVRQQRLPLVGRVSMDMISVDARRLPDIQIGEEVVLWGDALPVEEVARMAGTIAYELLCGVTQRVHFVDLRVS
jgi:alanine racemase